MCMWMWFICEEESSYPKGKVLSVEWERMVMFRIAYYLTTHTIHPTPVCSMYIIHSSMQIFSLYGMSRWLITFAYVWTLSPCYLHPDLPVYLSAKVLSTALWLLLKLYCSYFRIFVFMPMDSWIEPRALWVLKFPFFFFFAKRNATALFLCSTISFCLSTA